MTTTYTVAAAEANSATAIHVVDTVANILGGLSNGSLLSRVSLFSMSAAGTVTAAQAEIVGRAEYQFEYNGHTLTIRDTVANLTNSGNTAGLGISGVSVTVADTAANILASLSIPVVHNANAIAVTASATLTLANLLSLESFSSFAAAGVTLTLLDTATNLLAFTTAEAKPALTVFHLSTSASVTVGQAITLAGLSHFAVSSPATLTVSGSIGLITGSASSLSVLLAMTGVAVNFSDTLSNLLAQAGTFNWYKYPGVSVTLSSGGQTTAANLLALEALPSFTVGSGVTLKVADSVANLLTLNTGQAATATSITLNGNGIVTATQLATLASFGNFTAGSGNTLTVDDTLAHIAAITVPQHALISAVTIDDTVTDLLSAQVEYASEVAAASKVVAELDGTTIDAAQAVALAALGTNAILTLHANGSSTSLTISDTQVALTAAAASIAALALDGTVVQIPQTSSDRSILTASAAAALVQSDVNPASETLSVADSGAAVTQYASEIFGQGFQTITVTTGILAGAMAQLLDPTLHFDTGSTAQLNANAVANITQALALAALPGFSRAGGVTLVVQDSISNILAAAATLGTSALGSLATSIQATNSETVSAAGAETLATLSGFSLHGNFLNIADTAANLAAAPAPAIALAVGVSLTSDARISVATADVFAAMGSTFSVNGFFILISDTVANLDALAGNAGTLATVNGWGGEATLSADGSASVANAAALLQISGFNVGIHHLTLSDSGSNLLAAGNTVLALANAVQLSHASTVSAAGAATLEAMHGFIPGSFLTIADTPTALAAMSASLASEATSVTLAMETGGNTSAYAIDAAQFAAMLALPHLSFAGFAGTIAVSDTAAALAALAPSLTALSVGALSTILMTLDASATVTAAVAESLDGLPSFSTGSANLTISDTAAALSGLDMGTAGQAAIIELSTPATLTAAAAASLAALAQFTADADPVTIADTPANLAAQSNAAASIAATETILPYPGSNAADYTLNASQFTALVSHSDLSFAGFAGPLILLDNATNLAGLAAAFAGAVAGSPIAQASVVVTTELSAGATVSSETVTELMALPNFGLNGQTLILQDTPTALLTAFLGLHPHVSEVELAANDTPWLVSAQQGAELAAMGTFAAGPAGMTVSDTATNLLATAYAAGVAAATATELDADATVSVSEAEALQALPSFSRDGFNLTISDTAENIATLNGPTEALATLIETVGGTSGGTTLTVAAFNSLILAGGFSGSAGSLTIADTATALLTLVDNANLADVGTTILQAGSSAVTGAQAEQLNTLPNLQVGANLSVVDSAADLLYITGGGGTPDDWAIVLQANSVTLNANATGLTAAQGALLAALGSHFHNGGFTVSIADSPTALLGLLNMLGPIASQITAVTVAVSGGPWSISGLATMAELRTLPHFAGSTATLTISDTVSDLTASANAGLITAIDSSFANATFTLAGDDTASVAQAEKLYTLEQASHFSVGDSTLAIVDTARDLATLDAGTAGMATTIELQDNALTTAVNYQKISVLPNFSDNDNLLVVSDTATNLLTLLSGTNLTFATEFTLSTPATGISAATAEQLTTLPNFTTGVGYITILDTAADLVAGSGAHPTDWSGEVRARSITLSASGPAITAAQAGDLAALGSRFSTGSYTVAVSDSAANLLSAANAAGVALAGTVTLSGNETALTAASWAQINALNEFSKGGHSVTISDTAADLAAANPTLLAAADHVQLSTAATLTVAAAETLIGLANYQAGATLTIGDTLQNLLLLGSADLANNNATLVATPIELSADAIANVAQMTALAALAEYGSFSLNGHIITLEDSGLDIAGFTASSGAIPAAYVMVGDATLSVAQAQILANDDVTIGANHLTVADTPANLLTVLSSDAAVNDIATALSLPGASSATVAQIETLAADPRFTTGGYALTVTGTASRLLGLGDTAQLATSLVLTGSNNNVDASGLLQLAEFGSKFSTNDVALTVSDTAANLAALNNLETALVTGAILNTTPGTAIDTATATELANLPDFTLGEGVTLTVQGSYAQLEALPGLILSIATLEVTGSGSTLTAAEAANIAATLDISPLSGVTVQDTLANLTNVTGWQSIATAGYIVADTASDLLANASSPLIAIDAAGLDSVTLTQDAQVSAGQFATLAAIPLFSLGTASLTVADTAPAIAAEATQIASLASTAALVDSAAPVTASHAEALAGLNNDDKLSFTGGVLLAVQDSYTNITNVNNAAGIALANSVTVVDSPANLLTAAAHNWGTLLPDFEPNASGTIDGEGATALYALGGRFLPVNGDVLTVQDTVSGILGNTVAIEGLGLKAQVVDSLADVDGAISALGDLGTTLQSITLTDGGAVGASAAADVQPLATLLSASLAVSDTAVNVDGSLAGLEGLGAHLTSVTVNDSASNVGTYASALAGALTSKLQVTLTDTMALGAGVAAGLAPVAAYLADDTSFTVSAMAADVSTNLDALESLVGHGLSGIALTDDDGTPNLPVTLGQISSDAAALALISPLFDYVISGSSAAIAGDLGEGVDSHILALNQAGRIGSLLVTGGVLTLSVATLLAAGVDTNESDALAKLEGATVAVSGVTILDFASFSHLQVPPTIFQISDTGAAISTDLDSGGSSVLLTYFNDIIGITASSTIEITYATDTTTHVNDGAGSLLSLVTGAGLIVDGVPVAQIAALLTSLTDVVPGSITVADTAGAIQTDLSGSTPVLLHYADDITSIASSGTITLDADHALVTGVDSGAGSVFSKLGGTVHLDVTGALVSQLGALAALTVQPVSVAVSDSGSTIAADLEDPECPSEKLASH